MMMEVYVYVFAQETKNAIGNRFPVDSWRPFSCDLFYVMLAVEPLSLAGLFLLFYDHFTENWFQTKYRLMLLLHVYSL